ncbi:MAG TPA: hypothetical protein VGM77_07725 [Gemmatimonadales bacterium]|jgi:hypothetical protein
MVYVPPESTAGHPADSPVGPDAPTEDRIGTAGYAMAAAACTAVTWFALLTFIQTQLIAGSTVQTVSQVDPQSFAVNFLVYGALLGISFSAVVAWVLMAPIPSSYRRGGLAMAGALAGTVPAGALTVLVRALGGAGLLLVLALLAGLVTFWFGRRAVLSAQ